MVRVLFVCLGNICRSPMAEGLFRRLAAEAGLLDRPGGIEADSAGTAGYHVGEPPDARAVAAAAARGVDISTLRARRVEREDFGRFDHILAMDRSNLAHLTRLAPATYSGTLSLFLARAPALGVEEVPDPYYGGDAGFARCLDLIEAGATALLDDLSGRARRAR